MKRAHRLVTSKAARCQCQVSGNARPRRAAYAAPFSLHPVQRLSAAKKLLATASAARSCFRERFLCKHYVSDRKRALGYKTLANVAGFAEFTDIHSGPRGHPVSPPRVAADDLENSPSIRIGPVGRARAIVLTARTPCFASLPLPHIAWWSREEPSPGLVLWSAGLRDAVAWTGHGSVSTSPNR
jgi:hypothetical protein